MRIRRLWLLLLAAAPVFLISTPAHGESELRITFLPVTKGDAALYQGPCGALGLIDTSQDNQNLELIRGALTQSGANHLEWVTLSHYDYDHIANIKKILEEFHPKSVYDRGGDIEAKDSKTYRAYYRWLEQPKRPKRKPLKIDDTFNLCSGPEKVTFTVLSVGTDGTAAGGVVVKKQKDENDKGLCLKVTYGEFDLATCGDISGGIKPTPGLRAPVTTDASSIRCYADRAIKDRRPDVESAVAPRLGDVEFAKVNHHGSPYSSNPYFVSTLRAQASVIVGAQEQYDHPDCRIVQRWQTQGTVYLTTNPDGTTRDGSIVVTTSGHERFVVTTTGSHRTDAYPMDATRGPVMRLVLTIAIGALPVLMGWIVARGLVAST